MKKKLLFVVASLMLFTMSGCMGKIELDEEQEAKFIGYSVYSVLEHDKNYMLGLNQVENNEEESFQQSDESQPATSEPDIETPTAEKNESDSSSDASENVNMEDALGVDGVSIIYKDMEICDSYPEADGTPVFSFKALSGKKLVVLKFDMKNNTDSDIKVDILSKKLSFRGIFNNAVKTTACVTLLPEAMNTYNSTIKAGETVETLLVFEMSDGYVTNLSDIKLEVRSENGTSSVEIK